MSYPYHLYGRAEWGARKPEFVTSQGPAMEAYLHHTENGDAAKISQWKQMTAAMRTIQDFHMDGRGWSDIGYHFILFQPDGNHEHATAFAGRHPGLTPAAQLGHNRGTLAIAVYGDGDVDALHLNTRYAIEALTRTFAPKVKMFGGHRDVTATDCPGRRFYAAVSPIAQALGVRTAH